MTKTKIAKTELVQMIESALLDEQSDALTVDDIMNSIGYETDNWFEAKDNRHYFRADLKPSSSKDRKRKYVVTLSPQSLTVYSSDDGRDPGVSRSRIFTRIRGPEVKEEYEKLRSSFKSWHDRLYLASIW